MHRVIRVSSLLMVLVPLLQACGANGAATVSTAIADGASALRGNASLRETTVRVKLPSAQPYVCIVYPEVRSEADKELLRQFREKTEAVGPKVGNIVPTLENMNGVVVVWQRGAIVKFDRSFGRAARARQVFAVERADGGTLEIGLKKEGLDVFVTSLR